MIPTLFLAEIDNRYIRENFKQLREFVKGNLFTNGESKAFEWELTSGDNELKHALGFIPTDAIITYSSNDSATVKIKHSLSTKTHLTINTTADTTVRVKVGKL